MRTEAGRDLLGRSIGCFFQDANCIELPLPGPLFALKSLEERKWKK
jgi:hypothetical protein